MDASGLDWHTWGPPLIVLGVGLAVGLGFALSRPRAGAPASAPDPREALLARKEQLVEAVRELDADRGKLGDEAWAARREVLVAQTADVLRALDTAREAPAAAPGAEGAADAGKAAPYARRERWILGLAGAIFIVGLAALLVSTAKPRQEGQSMTGGTANDQAGPPPEIAAALAAVEKNPKDIDALNTLTWAAIRMRSLDGAMQYLSQAREVAPDDPYVQTHLGILSLQVKMYDRAIAAFDAALAAKPGLPRAMVWKGVALWQTGDLAGAEAALQAVLTSPDASSDERSMAGEVMSEMKKPPPQVRVTGQVALAEGVAAPQGGVLFIIARRAAEGGGPPLAAQRSPGAAFPADFKLSDQDVMMGGAWPDQVWVQARLDADGNPTTKGEGDLESEVVGPLSTGAQITLTLASPR